MEFGFIKKILKDEKKVKLILVIGGIGMALIFLSQFVGKAEGKTFDVSKISSQTTDLSEYAEKLEAKLYDMVSNISGVGEAKIMVTLESGVEYVYANEEKKNTDLTRDSDGKNSKTQEKDNYEQTLILTKNGNQEGAILKTQIEPKVKGVVVVCTGGENALVQQMVTEAVKTALDIDSNRVCITKSS